MAPHPGCAGSRTGWRSSTFWRPSNGLHTLQPAHDRLFFMGET